MGIAAPGVGARRIERLESPVRGSAWVSGQHSQMPSIALKCPQIPSRGG